MLLGVEMNNPIVPTFDESIFALLNVLIVALVVFFIVRWFLARIIRAIRKIRRPETSRDSNRA